MWEFGDDCFTDPALSSNLKHYEMQTALSDNQTVKQKQLYVLCHTQFLISDT